MFSVACLSSSHALMLIFLKEGFSVPLLPHHMKSLVFSVKVLLLNQASSMLGLGFMG